MRRGQMDRQEKWMRKCMDREENQPVNRQLTWIGREAQPLAVNLRACSQGRGMARQRRTYLKRVAELVLGRHQSDQGEGRSPFFSLRFRTLCKEQKLRLVQDIMFVLPSTLIQVAPLARPKSQQKLRLERRPGQWPTLPRFGDDVCFTSA